MFGAAVSARKLALLGAVLLAGCAMHATPRVHAPPGSAVVGSGWPTRSGSTISRVDGGLIIIDLGWRGAAPALRRGLEELGAPPDSVIAVFLTHAHRDHVAAGVS